MHKPSIIAVLLALGAVSPLSPVVAQSQAQSGPPCGGVNHCVDITISGGVIQNVVNVIVPAKNHQIYWRIVTPGYTFAQPPAPDAIAWKAPSAINDNGKMPPNEFPCSRVSATQFRCTDANSTHGTVRTYQYEITVLDSTGKQLVLDPWIINQ